MYRTHRNTWQMFPILIFVCVRPIPLPSDPIHMLQIMCLSSGSSTAAVRRLIDENSRLHAYSEVAVRTVIFAIDSGPSITTLTLSRCLAHVTRYYLCLASPWTSLQSDGR